MQQALDHLLDLAGGFLRPLCQRAYLVGHYRETAPFLAGTRGLDRRVQCQQVGLFGDAADNVQHGADLIRVLVQLRDRVACAIDLVGQVANRVDHALHGLAAVAGDLLSICRRTGRGRCAARHFFY